MARIECTIEHGITENEQGRQVDCTIARCGQCGYETTSYGVSDASMRRCLVLLNRELPDWLEELLRRGRVVALLTAEIAGRTGPLTKSCVGEGQFSGQPIGLLGA